MVTCGVAASLLACCSDGEAAALSPFKCEGVAATVNKLCLDSLKEMTKLFPGKMKSSQLNNSTCHCLYQKTKSLTTAGMSAVS